MLGKFSKHANIMRHYVETILKLKQISKSFSGVTVLHSVDITLKKGEVLCLAGENGAGKSTLIKILSGAIHPDSGSIEIFGHEFSKLHPSEAIDLGVATIYQDVDLVDTLTVADNIFLNNEILKKGLIVDREKQEEQTALLLKRLSMKIDPGLLVSNLSPGQKQNLQIAKALHRKAKILIMDEPTASLGEEETTALIALVKSLKAEGIGIIYISHYLDEIFTLGDTVFVLKDGHHISTRQIIETNQEQLIHDMVGRDASSLYKRLARYGTNDQALQVKNYSRGTLVKGVSFSVSKGEIFGLGGLVGAGRTELVRLLFGADKADSGTLVLEGKNITPRNPKQAIKHGICYVSEDRKQEGLFLPRSTAENISLIKNDDHLLLDLSQEVREVGKQIASLGIKVFNQEHEVGKLSGGNQQKVAIARWLLAEGDVFIFDEPSKGVDVGAREEIYHLMENLAKNGKIIIMVSSTMTELISLSDRIGVMREGELVTIIPEEDFSEDNLLKLYIGV
jgi:ribose transport system ATP-binding protein